MPNPKKVNVKSKKGEREIQKRYKNIVNVENSVENLFKHISSAKLDSII